MFGKEVFPATEFAVGVFPTFSRLRAASKRGNDDDEPDAFWFFHNGSVVMQVRYRDAKTAKLKSLPSCSISGFESKKKIFTSVISY